MAEVKIGTRKKFGPYKGSEQNGGRPIYVWKVKTKDGWRTETKNKARSDYEDKHGKLPKTTDVDHKNNGGRKGDDRQSNLQAMSHKQNVAKENKRRVGKK
jgi:hypothetical protein